MKKVRYYLLEILATIVAVSSIIILIFIWQASSIINKVGGLSGVIENILVQNNSEVELDIDKVNIGFGGFKNPFKINAENVSIKYLNEDIEIETLQIILSPISLLNRKIKPKQIKIQKFKLNFYETIKNKFIKKDNYRKWEKPELLSYFVSGLNLINESIPNFQIDLSGIDIFLKNGSADFQFLNQKKEKLKNININIKKRLDDIRGEGSFIIFDKKIDFKISKPKGQIFIFSFDFIELSLSKITKLLFKDTIRVDAKSSGKLNLELGENFKILNLNGNLKLINLNYQTSAFPKDFLDSYQDLNSEFDFNYNFKKNELKLDKILIKKDKNILKGLLAVNFLKNNIQLMKLDINIDQVQINSLPKNLIRSISYLKIKNGELKNINILGQLEFKKRRLNSELINLLFDGEIKNANIKSKVNSYNNFNSKIDSKFFIKIGKNFKLISAKGKAKSIKSELFKSGMTIPLKINDLNFDWKFENNKIGISNIFSKLDNSSNFSGAININLDENRNLNDIALEFKSPKIKYDLIKSSWPDGFGEKSRKWLKQNVDGGYAENIFIEMKYDRLKEKINSFDVNWKHKFSNINYLKNMPHALVESAYVKINEKEMTIDFEDLIIDEVKLNNTKLKIFPVFNPNAKAEMKFSTFSDVEKILKLLDEKELNLLKANKIGKNATGKIELDAFFKWPIKENLPRSLFSWSVSGFGTGIGMNTLPYDMKLSDANIEIKSTNNSFTFNSIGKINGIMNEFSLQKNENQKPKVFIRFEENYELTKLIEKFSKFSLDGMMGGIIEIDEFDFDNFTAKTVIQLDKSSLEIPIFKYKKVRGVKGLLICDLIFKNGHINEIKNIQGEIGAIMLDGDIKFSSSGDIVRSEFNHFSIPGIHLSKMNLNKDKNNKYILDIEGESIDIRYLLKNLEKNSNNKSGRNPIIFSLKSNNILLPGNIRMSGKVTGLIDKKNNVTADIKANIRVNENIFLNNASLYLEAQDDGLGFEGKAFVENETINLKLNPQGNKDKIFEISAQNAGKILNSFKITNLIRGGSIDFFINVKNNDFKNYETTIDLYDFHVIDAPILVKLISTLSLTGLLNILEDKGIFFSKGKAEMFFENGYQRIKKIEAIGEAMAITLDGWINKKKNIMQIHGTMAPATLLNKLLEPIPLLSELLTGGDKAGIVLTEFRLDGSISKPMISFRPLSSAPGLLRDIFNLFRSDNMYLKTE